MLSRLYEYMWTQAYMQNIAAICSLLQVSQKARVLDIGCGDGKNTLRFQQAIGCEKITGIDGVRGRLDAAKKRGVLALHADLEKRWPFKSATMDVVITNQVIEHIVDLDNFIMEVWRVLVPGGYCVVSTENLASWHNIASLVLGFQDFSHHLIKRAHVGNPLSPHYNEKTASWSKKDNSGFDDSTYPHIKILTLKSLIAVFEAYGFSFEQRLGSGYYPFVSGMSRLATWLDPFHSHFITIKVQKPKYK
ncbi:hypothetical protein A2875_01390 [Candidatus Gottesmanbacteria bacterium RIFCSPHIGHO2_01_FULL_46_14]|uniref:Methyltransferase type 11 domain-containing protein n=3 Tax=Microgenomates group TaxID=1794810 RepID=A0A1F5ZRB3_9BACT|nr:MAG: hypothetical protein A2875_01390 [Candidatus Gottesmanbacteria bacterium RIFCSPHIGHO2_01_FULL_46_14]OGG28616.1 MAG: hypothetical protein A2971_02840 [Candidatus Gottesmanbacteria bacterium RIFCSPLOWO2_01_FULL_46_21]